MKHSRSFIRNCEYCLVVDISLKALNYFLTAVEIGTISGAAKELHVVPSAVLAGVNQVEDAFGLQLTTRHRSRGIALTADGQALKPKIQHLLDEYRTLLKEGADLRSQLTGILRVGYYAPVAPAFMPTVIAELFAGNTDLEIKFIDCDDQVAQDGLLNGRFDVIVCVAENMRPRVTYETLSELPAYLLTPIGHPLAQRPIVHVSDLTNEPLVLLDLPNISEYYSQVMADADVVPRVVATATNVEMVRSLVASGLGCSVLHMQPLTTAAYNGGHVAAVPLDRAIPPMRIVIGHHADNPRRLVRAFVDRCVQYFGEEESERLIVV